MKVLLLQVLTPEIKEYSKISIPINIEYSVKWNIDYHLYTALSSDNPYHPAWLKITSLYDINYQKYDWIWILDCDCIINNQEIDIKDLIKREPKPIIISINDINGGSYLNSGSMIFKSDFIPEILKKYEECVSNGYRYLTERFWEQEFINDLYKNDNNLFSVREMSELNSYWKLNLLTMDEQKKYGVDNNLILDQSQNLVHHYMSLPNHIRIRWMKQYFINKHFMK